MSMNIEQLIAALKNDCQEQDYESYSHLLGIIGHINPRAENFMELYRAVREQGYIFMTEDKEYLDYFFAKIVSKEIGTDFRGRKFNRLQVRSESDDLKGKSPATKSQKPNV